MNSSCPGCGKPTKNTLYCDACHRQYGKGGSAGKWFLALVIIAVVAGVSWLAWG